MTVDYAKLLAVLRFFVRTDTLESKAAFCRIIRNRYNERMDGDKLEDTLHFLLQTRDALWAFSMACEDCSADELCRDCKELLIAWEASKEPIHTATHFRVSLSPRARESIIPLVTVTTRDQSFKNKGNYTEKAVELFAYAETLTASATPQLENNDERRTDDTSYTAPTKTPKIPLAAAVSAAGRGLARRKIARRRSRRLK